MGGPGPIWGPGAMCGGRGPERWRDPNLLPGDIAAWPSAPDIGSALRAPGTRAAPGTLGAPGTAAGGALPKGGWELPKGAWELPQRGWEGGQATAAFGGAVGGAALAPGSEGVITSYPSSEAFSGFGFDLNTLLPSRAAPHLAAADA